MQSFADHDSNFDFLAEREPEVYRLAEEAEVLASISPNTCIMQVRLVAELLAKSAATLLNVYRVDDLTFFKTLKRLQEMPEFGQNIRSVFHTIREDANDVTHGEFYVGAKGVARNYLKMARKVAVWYQQTFVDPGFSPGPFQDPPDYEDRYDEVMEGQDELRAKIEKTRETIERVQTKARVESQRRAEAEEVAAELREERDVYETLAREYEEELTELRRELDARPTAEAEAETAERRQKMQEASDRVELSEAETRSLIDGQLRRAGWMADTDSMRWADGDRPEEGQSKAIAEVPVDGGHADYLLFDGLTPVAVIEAKRWERDVAGEVEQAKRYARTLDLEDLSADIEPPGGPWEHERDRYTIPFVFATNGRDFHHVLRNRRGVWFQDMRRPTNRSRPLGGWYTPDGLRRLLARDADQALADLEEEPLGYLGLRDYQEEAVRAVEHALERGQRRALLAMATGTGKTRTAIGLAYRLIKSGMFRRILFVVDRRSLGRQAYESFETVDVEGARPFTEIYSTRDLETPGVGPDTRLSFATIQSMVHRGVEPDEGEPVPPIDQFDCLIVDEAHRGYNLDREMSETEMKFRDPDDFISKYKRVLDHFDAVRIGLTATPAKKTTDIFGRPVYTYRYKQAVIEGHLVDQDEPIKMTTHLMEHGIDYEPGEQLTLLDTQTGEIDFAEAPDELSFDVSQFNRAIKVPAFNEAICAELAKRIDLERPGKTLVFCVDEDHAQQVAAALREAYADRDAPAPDAAVKVITGYTDDAEGWLRRYKNEKRPKIAVTCDYLTTGVDVPRIVNLVFLRRVKSRILYEQMKGRATRLCDAIHKDAYQIYDCVDLYDGLEQVTDMKPVVTQPDLSLRDHFDEMMEHDERDVLSVAQQDFVGKLQRKSKRLSEEGERKFEQMAGMSTAEFVANVRDREPDEAAGWLEGKEKIVDRIPELPIETKGVVYEPDAEDRVIAIETGERDRAGYLDQFETWIEAHIEEWETLQMVANRPRELTREALVELQQELAREGYTSDNLQTAWHQRTNREVAASIIGFVRQAALGEPLVPYAERVQFAVDRIKQQGEWSGRQRKWLDRIGKTLIKNEQVPDPANLDQDPFTNRGGFDRIDQQHFDGRLAEVLDRINDEMWEYEAGA